MKKTRQITIYHRLVAFMSFLVLITAVVPYVIFAQAGKQSLIKDIKNQLLTSVARLTEYLERNHLPLTDLEQMMSADRVRVIEDITELNLPESQLQALQQEQEVVFVKIQAAESDGTIYAALVRYHDVYIAMTMDLEPIFLVTRRISLFSVLISLALGILTAIYASHRMLRPMRDLIAAIQKVAEGDFSQQVSYRCRNDEISILINSFNIMTKELRSVEMLRSDFISDISHEFKTPLTAIEGYAKLLEETSEPAERKEYVQIITEETRRLSMLAQNILTLNKLEQGGIQAQKAVVSVDEQIRRVLTLYESKWTAKHLELELELEEITCTGYALLLMQVWNNLIDNAIKFSPDGGKIIVLLTEEYGQICFRIQNEGTEISDEVKKHIFDKFYQGDRSRGSDGNGLGLSIVKRVAEIHGGTIEVETPPQGGVGFVLRL